MASSLVLTLKLEDSQTVVQQLFQPNTNKKKEAMLALSMLFKEIASGRRRAQVDIQTGGAAPVAASQTLTLTSVVATDTVVIGTETLTFTSTPSTENHVEVDGATDADDATALAAAINAHSVLSTQVSASAASNVVTVTDLQEGVGGNAVNISATGGTIAVGSSDTHLEGGTGGVTEAAVAFNMGIT